MFRIPVRRNRLRPSGFPFPGLFDRQAADAAFIQIRGPRIAAVDEGNAPGETRVVDADAQTGMEEDVFVYVAGLNKFLHAVAWVKRSPSGVA
jgi:hypothetical protein